MDKQELMIEAKSASVVAYAAVCDASSHIVWGEGDLNSPLLIVGEAPGAQEDRMGRPFVGPAGQLLSQELQMAGILRDQVYITNVVKCRPRQASGGRASTSNRTPTVREIAAWRETINREIEIVSPRVVLCLGAVAASALIHRGFAMNAERGRWFDGPLGTLAIATFHPAYLLRVREYGSRSVGRPGGQALADFREDLNVVVAELRKLGALKAS